jgi:transcriptional regulator with XRE-family HTH domain
MTNESLARGLRILRAARGITLAEAEELTGVTRETLGALEHGQRGAYTSTLEKIAAGYGTTVSALLEEDEPALASAAAAKDEASEAEAPSVTVEQLRELGIKANPSQVNVLNQMIAYRANPTGEIHAYGYVKKPDQPVDFAQVEHMFMPAYLLATGAISEDHIREAREALAETKELAGFSR